MQREEMQVPVYYSLRFLERLLGVGVPEGALAAVRPDPVRRWLHQRYLPEGKVLSLQPMPRRDFTFAPTRLFGRLLPGRLVMGRRREKLRTLVRGLLPAPAQLRAFYGLKQHQSVARYYWLRPRRLARAYLSEASGAIAARVGTRAAIALRALRPRRQH